MKKTKNLEWDPALTAAESARAVLPGMAASIFANSRKATEGRIKLKRLHAFRLQVKRFRYTLELFEPLYGPAAGDRLARLRRLQQLLGKINDCAVSRALLENSRPGRKEKASTALVLKHIRTVEAARTKKFVAYWQTTFDIPGEEERWTRYLGRFAGRGGALRDSDTASAPQDGGGISEADQA